MSTATATGGAPPFWTRGDLNAFFGFGINMLVNVLVLSGLAVAWSASRAMTCSARSCRRSASSC